MLEEIGPEHFDSELNRRLREHLAGAAPADDAELVGTVAELDARAEAEAIDETTAQRAPPSPAGAAACAASSPRPTPSG